MKKITVIVLFTCLLFSQLYSKPEISIKETTFDFGDILESNGKVHHKFFFTNIGDEPLKIKKVSSS
ncbi:MAG: DUF1573 domain-containing protein [Candidatus Cloacimonetes bacterium]|nr:DUF1573 domain-containing protein [Candidatus Cloacimonadota bacterium]